MWHSDIGDFAVELTAEVPVWRCSACNAMYMDHEGEEACHEAVCRHLRVLTPREIRKIRGERTRQAFHEATGIAEASLKRWESGEQIQTSAMDTLLRLLGNPVAASQLSMINADRHRQADQAAPSFRSSLSQETEKRAKIFELRRAG